MSRRKISPQLTVIEITRPYRRNRLSVIRAATLGHGFTVCGKSLFLQEVGALAPK
jgi:hypothetical protein